MKKLVIVTLCVALIFGMGGIAAAKTLKYSIKN